MGDGVLAYFGYPQAHEDDAERAVRAGLDLIAGLAALKESVVLQVRVGIATGLVVVGDLIGAGEAQERGIMTKAVLDAEGESEAPRDERVRALLIYQNQAARARQAFSALVSSEKSADWRGKLKRPCLFLEKVEWSGTSPSRPSRQNQR
jgi:hypothetical protein